MAIFSKKISTERNHLTYLERLERIKLFLEKTLSPPRYIHSVSTALLMKELCPRFNLDREKGEIAGLLHDVARELPVSRIMALARGDGKPVEPWEEQNPMLLHGRAGAVMAQEQFGIDDAELLEAVACHTLGCERMSRLALCLYVADYLEARRGFLSAERREAILAMDLDSMGFEVVSALVNYLSIKSLAVAEPTLKLYQKLKKRVESFESDEEL